MRNCWKKLNYLIAMMMTAMMTTAMMTTAMMLPVLLLPLTALLPPAPPVLPALLPSSQGEFVLSHALPALVDSLYETLNNERIDHEIDDDDDDDDDDIDEG